MSAPESYDPGPVIIERIPPLERGLSSGQGPMADAVGPVAEATAPSRTAPDPARTRPAGTVRTRLTVQHRFTRLDGLRGTAALLVVVYHLRPQFRDAGGPLWLDRFFGGGFLMVDLFFVLSGFVLARTMFSVRSAGDATRFALLRYRRFLPLHLTAIAITAGISLVVWYGQHHGLGQLPGERHPFDNPRESPHGYLSALVLLQGVVGPKFAGYNAGWSLSVELWGNILLVAAIALVWRARLTPLVGPLALGAGAFMLLTWGPGDSSTVGWVALGRGLLGLGAGLSVYWLYATLARRGGVWRWATTGAVLGTISLGAYMYWQKDLRDLVYLPLAPITGLLVFSLAQPTNGRVHRLLDRSVLQWLGSRSFALYALHQPVMGSVLLASKLRGLHLDQPKVAVFIFVTSLIGALVAADIGHRFIERLLVPKKRG